MVALFIFTRTRKHKNRVSHVTVICSSALGLRTSQRTHFFVKFINCNSSGRGLRSTDRFVMAIICFVRNCFEFKIRPFYRLKYPFYGNYLFHQPVTQMNSDVVAVMI